MTPERSTRWLLLMSLFGFFYRGYWIYSGMEKFGPGGYLNLAEGHAAAPFQYRIGVVKIATLFYEYGSVPFRYSFSVLDLLGSTLAVLLGYQLLLRSAVYRRTETSLRWFGSAAFLSLVLYLMSWQDAFKKPETQPAAGLVLLLLWLWSADHHGESVRGPRIWITALGLLAVTLALSLVRAEMALLLNLGVLAVGCLKQRGLLALRRDIAMILAGVCAALAEGTQLWLMDVAYPNAPRTHGKFLFVQDIWRPNELLIFLLFVLPAGWTITQVARRRFTRDAAGVGFLVGAVPFIGLWMLIGRVEEVRIFLPIALAVTPLAVQMLILYAEDSLARAGSSL